MSWIPPSIAHKQIDSDGYRNGINGTEGQRRTCWRRLL